MKFYQHFRISKHQFNYLLQEIEKKLEKEECYLPRRKITCGEISNLSSISAFQVNVISLKKRLLKLQKNTDRCKNENNRIFIIY
jgi:hypothetical protein